MAVVHYISMIIIGIGSFIFGILPVVFSLRSRSYPFLLSLTLCLGAGVLLATSLVHMLTEVQMKLKLYAQLYFCVGFLILYSFDEIMHYCLGDKLETGTVAPEQQRNHNNKGHDYGTFDKLPDFSESSPFHRQVTDSSSEQTIDHCYSATKFRSYEEKDEARGMNEYLGGHCSHSRNGDKNEIHSHIKSGQQCSSPASKTGLFIALFIHSVLEGISIGVQNEFSQIIFILGAVSFHKVVLSFCLGLEMHNHGLKAAQLLSAIFLFSIGSPIGIFLGMTVTIYKNGIFGIDAQLQAVAAGSLLYVAAFEVMPRERSKWKHSAKRAAGIFQFLFLLVGFTFITLFHLFVGLAHDSNKNGTHVENLPW